MRHISSIYLRPQDAPWFARVRKSAPSSLAVLKAVRAQGRKTLKLPTSGLLNAPPLVPSIASVFQQV